MRNGNKYRLYIHIDLILSLMIAILNQILYHCRVIVSVVSIKGTDCRIIELGQVADQTGGKVCICMYLNQLH